MYAVAVLLLRLGGMSAVLPDAHILKYEKQFHDLNAVESLSPWTGRNKFRP